MSMLWHTEYNFMVLYNSADFLRILSEFLDANLQKSAHMHACIQEVRLTNA